MGEGERVGGKDNEPFVLAVCVMSYQTEVNSVSAFPVGLLF